MLTLSLSHRTQRNVGTFIFSCYICFSHYFPCLSAFHICHHFSLHLIWFFSFSKKYCFMPLLCNQVLLMKVPCHYVWRSFVPACASGYLDMNRNSQKTTRFCIIVLCNAHAFRFASLNLLFSFCNKNSCSHLEICLDYRETKTNKSLLSCPFKWLFICIKCNSNSWLWIATPTQVWSQM